MIDLSSAESPIHYVTNFTDLVSTPFQGEVNAMCWTRRLRGDFSEIIKKVELRGNITTIEEEELRGISLSEDGGLARELLLNDLEVLRAHGAAPVLNVISYYDRDNDNPFFPTDVYSFHADRSPVPTDTFLCTYYGEPSEIVPNSQCIKKVLIPEIRDELKKYHTGNKEDFEAFLSEHCLDLHYEAKAEARLIKLGLGHLWRLSVEHPGNPVLPCIHRAPKEKPGESRLLLIC